MKKVSVIFLSLLLAFLLIAGGVLLSFSLITRSVTLQENKLKTVDNSIKLYDRDDNIIDTVSLIGSEKAVAVKDLSTVTKRAFCTVEDKNFYKHNGLNYKRMIGATLKNIKARSFKEGASTISQQLIKNTHLSGEKTLKRKLKEIKLTRQLEKRYDKDEILECYLNTIYFGHSCFGISQASKYYFQKSPSELTIAESATLAGLLKSPNNYSPFQRPENCKRRRDFVLKELYEEGSITERERYLALKEALPKSPSREQRDPFLSEVFAEAEELCGKEIYGELSVYTYLDTNLQKELALLKEESETDCTFIVGDNETHGIKGYYSTLQTPIKRLPGSTIKPLAVYAPAFEENLLSPATPILDQKTDFNGYCPSNFNGEYHGYVSARTALCNSLNVPAVKVLNDVGIKTSCDYLKKVGLTVKEEDESLALALGGISDGYELRDILSAYGVFSHEGDYAPYRFIRKIKRTGDTIYERKITKTKVFSEDTVTLINDVLSDAAKYGTAKKLKELDFPICAKTGTSGTTAKNVDAYTISYTGSDTVAVWLGNRDCTPIQTTGGGAPCIINKYINEYLYNNKKPKEINKSNKVININLDKTSINKKHKLVIADPIAPKREIVTELFAKRSIPKERLNNYSHPKITTKPEITYKNNTISIVLCNTEYFIYDIERRDSKGNVVSFQCHKSVFFDDTIRDNEVYTYILSPIYQNNKGEAYLLPAIKTKTTEENSRSNHSNIQNSSIQEKSWWNA